MDGKEVTESESEKIAFMANEYEMAKSSKSPCAVKGKV